MHRGNRGNNGQRGQQGYYNNTPNYGQVYAINETEGDTEYYTDNYDPSLHHSPVFCLDMIHQDVHQVHTNPGKKYFANILTLSTGSKYHPVKFQIDTAATCNTMSQELFNENFIHVKSNSPFLLFPYGNSTPIKPIGQVSLVFERKKKYHTLTFQILPSHVMENKPPLLSGNDSEKLGLVNIHADEVYALLCKTTSVKSTSDNTLVPHVGNFPPKCPLNKNDVLNHFSTNFSGIGCLDPPVSFKVKSDMIPTQMPIHHVPICKRVKEEVAIDNYIKAGDISGRDFLLASIVHQRSFNKG